MDDFADRLGAATPTPGGGAAAARVGVYACSLIRMVTGISLKKLSEGKTPNATSGILQLEQAQEAAIRLSQRFSELESEDMAAFNAYLDALRLPRSTEDEKAYRLRARREAAWRATEAPLNTFRAAVETLKTCQDLFGISKTTPLKAESDLGAAVEFAHAASRVARLNIRANLLELSEENRKAATEEWRGLAGEMEHLYAALSEPLSVAP